MMSAPREPRYLCAAAVIVSGLLVFSGLTHADQRLDAATSSCKTIDDCLNVLYDWSRTYNGRVEDVTVAVTNLKRFGDPMRRQQSATFSVRFPYGFRTTIRHASPGWKKSS